MNIEESIEYLKLKIKNDNLTIQGMFGDIYEEIQKDNTAIETLLIAYEQKCNYIKENEIYKKNLFNNYEEKCKEIEKEKEKNKELSEHADNLLGEKEYYQDSYDGITFKINNLISQIESAIDFMKTDKSKVKVDMYQQKEEDLKLEIVHLKKLLKEE